MSVVERIQALGPDEKFCLFEFFPPKTDAGFRNLLARLHRMRDLNPLFVSVTWGAGGSTSEKSLELAVTCQQLLGISTVLHLTCTNTNKAIIDDALSRAKAAGIRNILALRGDPPRTREYWTPECSFRTAVDLVRYIRAQYGDYFCIGVAGYPEGHVDGSDGAEQDPKRDLPYLEEKVAAGALFVVTQMFFDADKYVAFEKMVRASPVLKDVVLIPGLMPITTYKVFTRATKLSHALVPAAVAEQLSLAAVDDDQVKKIGVDVLSQLVADVSARSAARGFHFYTLNLERAVAAIVESCPELRGSAARLSRSRASSDPFESDLETSAPNAGKVESVPDSVPLVRDRRVTLAATWDDFPNGRFGDASSPAYGEIDGYGPSLKLEPPEAVAVWGTPQSVADVSRVFIDYLSAKILSLPWVLTELSPETALIQEQLFELNSRGLFTLASQPAVDSCPSSDSILGWGPRNGRIFQKLFVEFFVPKTEWERLLRLMDKDISDKTITYFCGNSKGEITTNMPHKSSQRTAITWGVFPSKEVLQPTVIDRQLFQAWNEEAFGLWLDWARCYAPDSPLYRLLAGIHLDYYLVSIVHNNYLAENALWDTLLQ